MNLQTHSDRSEWPAGILKPGGEIAKLYDLLDDGKWHDKAALLKTVNVKGPKGRLHYIKKFGKEGRKHPDGTLWSTQESLWEIEESPDGSQIRLVKLPLNQE